MGLLSSTSLRLTMFIRAGAPAVSRAAAFVGIPALLIPLYVTVLPDSTPPPIASLEALMVILLSFFQTNNVSFITNVLLWSSIV